MGNCSCGWLRSSFFQKLKLKQYQVIQNQTVLAHTIARLNDLPLAGYVLAVGEQDHYAQTLPLKNKHLSHFCLGGAERVDSVLNALRYLEQFAQADDLVFVHDAARPCVTQQCLENLVDTAINLNSSAILAIPVRDTLKCVEISKISIKQSVVINCGKHKHHKFLPFQSLKRQSKKL